MSRPISSFVGKVLYLDTMIFHAVLTASNPVAKTVLQQIQGGEIQGYTAVLTIDELAYRMLLSSIRATYGKSPLDQLRQNQAAMIDEFYPQVESQLLRLQQLPNLTFVGTTNADLVAMHQNIRAYRLLPRDALHLALMQRIGCTNLVSEDSDFDTVTGITRFVLV